MAIGKMSYEENLLDDAEDKFKRALHLVQVNNIYISILLN